MSSGCKICALDDRRLRIVNAALRAFQQKKIGLREISQQTGLPAGSLFRHSQRHLSVAPANAAPVQTLVPQSTVLPPASPAPTKEQLLSRLENVYQELTATTGEAKDLGDLNVRAKLLAETRRTLELQGSWSGHFPRRIVGSEPGCLVTLVVPQALPGAPEPEVVEIALPRRLR